MVVMRADFHRDLHGLWRDLFLEYAASCPHAAEADPYAARIYYALDQRDTRECIHLLALIIESITKQNDTPALRYLETRWGKLAREWIVEKERMRTL